MVIEVNTQLEQGRESGQMISLGRESYRGGGGRGDNLLWLLSQLISVLIMLFTPSKFEDLFPYYYYYLLPAFDFVNISCLQCPTYHHHGMK